MRHSDTCRKPATGWIARCLAVCLLALPLAAGAAPGADDIVVTAFKGGVQLTSAGASLEPRAGAMLALAASVRTGADGSIDLRQGETTIGVGPATQLEFPAQDAPGPVDRVTQPTGNVFYSVGPRGNRKMRVETPYLVAVIKGTQFNVAVTPESSTISLHEGKLEILATDGGAAPVMLNAGEVAVRRKGEPQIRVLKITSAASASAGSSGGRGGAEPAIPAAEPAGDDGTPGDFGPGNPGSPTEPVDIGVPAGASADASIDLGNGLIDTRTEVGVETGAASVGASVAAGVDLGAGTVEASAGAGLDAGIASVGAGVDAGIDLGSGAVDAGVGIDVGAGPASADAGVNAGVDLGSGSIDAGADAGVDAGPVSVDASVDANVDAAAGTIDAGVDASATGIDAGVDVGIDLTGGDAGVSVGVDLPGTEIDVGIGGGPPANESPATPGPGHLGGILGGILAPPGP